MRIKTFLLAILMLPIPAISAEHSDMKMGDMGSSVSSQAYMSGMNKMHEKIMVAVKEPDPDKTFAKDIIAHHEGAIAMAETELEHDKDPEMRKLIEDTVKAQEGEIGQVNKRLDNQK